MSNETVEAVTLEIGQMMILATEHAESERQIAARSASGARVVLATPVDARNDAVLGASAVLSCLLLALSETVPGLDPAAVAKRAHEMLGLSG